MMARLQDFKVEGVTRFAETPTTCYRYLLQLKSEKLSIWMEDLSSKKQWYKGELSTEDYVTPANIISDASAMDYLMFLQDSLSGEQNKCSDFQRTLEMLQKGALLLILEVKIHILHSSRVVKYAFVLNPVSVQRIDVLESKLRDQRDELERLRKTVDAKPAHIELKATATDASTSNLLWSEIKSDYFSVDGNIGKVSFRRPGYYIVTTMVNTSARKSDQLIQLMKRGVCVRKAPVAYHGYDYMTTLSTSDRFKTDDFVSVTCSGNVKEAFLSIAQIGL